LKIILGNQHQGRAPWHFSLRFGVFFGRYWCLACFKNLKKRVLRIWKFGV